MPKGWMSVSLPEELLKLVDKLLEEDILTKQFYKNRTSFIIDAVRRRIEHFLEHEEKEK